MSADDTNEAANAQPLGLGYGKPPVAARFKKGQSGNPKGRPKGAKGAKATVRRVLLQEHVVTPPGSTRARKLTTVELAVALLKQLAAAGNQRAYKAYMDLNARLGPADPDKPIGYLVVPEACETVEEWEALYSPKEPLPGEPDDSD